jgi:hypothetical protein
LKISLTVSGQAFLFADISFQFVGGVSDAWGNLPFEDCFLVISRRLE